MLNKQEKYNFIGCKDTEYNGKFYTAVKTTGIFYDSKSEAIENEFRACIVCKSDIFFGI